MLRTRCSSLLLRQCFTPLILVCFVVLGLASGAVRGATEVITIANPWLACDASRNGARVVVTVSDDGRVVTNLQESNFSIGVVIPDKFRSTFKMAEPQNGYYDFRLLPEDVWEIGWYVIAVSVATPSGSGIALVEMRIREETDWVAMPSYDGDCKQRPQGTVCVGFRDGYLFHLLLSPVNGWDYYYDEQEIQIAHASGVDLYHILSTQLVKIVSTR